MDIRGLGYLAIASSDLGAWERFACEVLGLMRNPLLSSDEALYLRMDERPYRVVVETSDADRFSCAGWQVSGPDDFEQACAELEAAGVGLERGTADQCDRRRVHDLVRLQDPSGNTLEIFHGSIYEHTPFVSPAATSGFVTGDLGMGHIVIPAPAYDECLAFYTEVLGFRRSDFMQMGPMTITFLHCNARHHSLALMSAESPNGLFHFMAEAKTLDDVGYALDRVQGADLHLSSTLGRHTNDQMTSFYVRSPSGFDVEFGCGGILVDDATWTTGEITAPSFWGHHWNAG
ncbi:VOC family protein [Myxococcota bacterium]|nr:VOC family protein [Myxococcota bacterium]